MEPGQETAIKAIRATNTAETKNPGWYLTNTITKNHKFPLKLGAKLLIQRGATEQWFKHQWTIGYTRSYLSKWGSQHYAKHLETQIANTYCKIFPATSNEASNPFFAQLTKIVIKDKTTAYQPLTENLLDTVPKSTTQGLVEPEVPRWVEEYDGIEINMDSEDVEERMIF